MAFHPKGVAFHGWYEGNYYRSYLEFIFGLWLKNVRKKIFTTECKALRGESGRIKIPDFAIFDPSGDLIEYFEVKASEQEFIESVVSYAENGFGLIPLKFSIMDRKSTSRKIKEIIGVIGKEEFDRINHEYRSQRDSALYTGFPGELNPMWGKHHTEESKNKNAITNSINNAGSGNPMYGHHHTDDAKVLIGAKWQNDETRKEILRKGYRTHFKKMISEQRIIYLEYLNALLIDFTSYLRPKFINRTYGIRYGKIIEIFGSVENFIFDLSKPAPTPKKKRRASGGKLLQETAKNTLLIA